MNVIMIISFLLVASNVLPINGTKEDEGYPLGLLSDCPGTTRKATIKRTHLKFLKFNVVHNSNIIKPNMTIYNYHQMAELARDPDVDFKRKKTVLYCTGYLDSPNLPVSTVPILMGSVYKRLGYNVLLLDMNRFATVIYPISQRFQRPVGKHVAEMLVNLTKYGLDPKKLELAGGSQGGQTIGFISKNFYNQTGVKIDRITGLDASGPCYRHLGPNDRLDQSDADFVDVIHTNIDGYGNAAPVGHVNFYVNGGEFQPGDFSMFPCGVLCSHFRSLHLWIAALLHPDIFIGLQCDSVQQAREGNCFDRQPRVTNMMGPKTDRNKTGIFYLATGNVFPYGIGKKGLKKENEPFKKTLGYFIEDYGDVM